MIRNRCTCDTPRVGSSSVTLAELQEGHGHDLRDPATSACCKESTNTSSQVMSPWRALLAILERVNSTPWGSSVATEDHVSDT